MTRARILADYVSGGTTAAEFDYLDGVTSNIQTQFTAKAPLASPAFTGSPSITLGLDATGDVYYRAAGGALTRLATGADGTVLTSTGVGAVPAFEAVPAGGITESDIWRVTSNASGDVNPIINWERADTYGAGHLGTGMTESSGIFTFPSTGIWYVHFSGMFNKNGSSRWISFRLHWAADITTFYPSAASWTFISHTDSGNTYGSASNSQILDVTDISQQRVKFDISWYHTTSATLIGSSTENQTSVSFIRLGDT